MRRLSPPATAWPILEAVFWIALIAMVIWPRVALWQALPTYVWSNDSGSYVLPAVRWLEGGEMDFGGRRGPIYPLLIAACMHWGGNLNTVVAVQHALGALSILLSIAVLRVLFGRAALPVLAACGFAAGLFNLPVYLEHLMRNETVLMTTCSAALCGFALALRGGRIAWAGFAGLMSGLTMVIKPILGPFPLVAAICLWWRGRGTERPWRSPVAYIAALAMVMFAPEVLTSVGAGEFEGEAYSGIQFYGRTAQWTKLDGGLYPEIKAKIAPLVHQYRAMEKLDNNLVIKRLIVPVIKQHLKGNPAPYPSLNKVCRQLAFEAVASQPAAFVGQAWSDFCKMHVRIANRPILPSSHDLQEVADDMRRLTDFPERLQRDEAVRVIGLRANKENFKFFEALTGWSWLFRMWPPVLWTSLLIVPLILFTRREHRLLWIALASLWYFNILLLSIVGKPMNRYLVPVNTVMIWALSYPFILIWLYIVSRVGAPPRRRVMDS